jgi:HK97 family phage portal protein
VFWAQFMRSALLKGMGYLIFEEDVLGAPIAGTLRLLNPDMVSPQWADGYIYRRIGNEQIQGGGYVETDFDGHFTLGGRTYRLIELLNPTGWVDEYGMTKGVLEMHATELGLANQAISYGTGSFRSGVPAGYLKTSVPNFNKEQADKLRARWLEHHGGDRRSIAVLNATTDFVPIQMSPLDMALIESRKMSLIDIANAFGVPAYMLGGSDGGSNTYSNAESRNRDFLSYSLLPWANALEDALSSLVPQAHYFEVAFNGLLKPDTATRYAAYSTALQDGWLTVDEVRLLESLPPMETNQAFGGPPAIDPNVPTDNTQGVPNAIAG